MWSNLIQYYKDPFLVSKIQEFFGVEIYYKNESCGNITNNFESNKNGHCDVKLSSSINRYYNQKCGNVTKEHDKDTCNNEKTKPYIIHNRFWYFLFLFGTELGDEIFFSIFMPFWIWNIDETIGRKIIIVWSIIMSIGQILKDIICWPRPPCPPVVRLQNKWSLEYGMPSTHAMVAVCIPFSVIFLTKNKYIYSIPIGFTVAILWCSLICVSRLYLGMHTVLDVIVGLVLAIGLMIVVIPIVNTIDDYLIRDNWAILLLIFISIMVIVYYPTGEKWTPTRGGTATVVGTGTGVYVGYWLIYKTINLTTASITPPYNINWPTYLIAGKIISRTFLGIIYVLIIKTLVKYFVYAIMCAILKENSKELKKSVNSLENKNKILVDLVYRYLFAFVITSSMTSLPPKIFTVFGIDRLSYYKEL